MQENKREDVEMVSEEQQLFDAVERDDVAEIRRLIKLGAPINVTVNSDEDDYPEGVKRGMSLFSFACVSGRVNAVEYFLQNGEVRADWEIGSFQGGVSNEVRGKINDLVKRHHETLSERLFRAVEENNTYKIRRLLDLGANVNAVDGRLYNDDIFSGAKDIKKTPLFLAYKKGYVDVVKCLLEDQSIDFNYLEFKKLRPYYEDGVSDSNKEKMNRLIDAHLERKREMFRLLQTNSIKGGMTLFSFACWSGNVRAVEYFLENGGSRTVRQIDSFKAGVPEEDKKKINDLIKRDLSKKLFKAIGENDVYEVNRLISLGVDINANYDGGFEVEGLDTNMTPLIFACAMGKVEAVKALYKHPKIEINHEEYDGEKTPLRAIIESKQGDSIKIAIVKLLLENDDLNPNHPGNVKESPLIFLLGLEFDEDGKVYVKHELGPNIPLAMLLLADPRTDVLYDSGYEEYIIAFACELGNVELVGRIINHGRFNKDHLNDAWMECDDVNSAFSLISIPCKTGNVEMLDLLVRNRADYNRNYDAGNESVEGAPILVACEYHNGEALLYLLSLDGIIREVKKEKDGDLFSVEQIIKDQRQEDLEDADPTYRKIHKLVTSGKSLDEAISEVEVPERLQRLTGKKVEKTASELQSVVDSSDDLPEVSNSASSYKHEPVSSKNKRSRPSSDTRYDDESMSGDPKRQKPNGKPLRKRNRDMENDNDGSIDSEQQGGEVVNSSMFGNPNKRKKLGRSTENNGDEVMGVIEQRNDDGSNLNSDNDGERMSIGKR